jgi:hypothetical protein
MQQTCFGDYIVRTFFRFQNELKLYHWQTQSYSRHKATDKLFSNFLEATDEFIEVLMGKFGKRVSLTKKPITIRTFTLETAPLLLTEFQQFLVSLDTILPKHRGLSDLLNIRDTLLGHVDQTLYLFSLD